MGPRPSHPMNRSVAIYNLGTIKRGDPGTFQLYITNTGEILLSVATPTTTGQPAYLTVTFTKTLPMPGFPALVNPGQTITIEKGYHHNGYLDRST